jgi:hypothetical protein
MDFQLLGDVEDVELIAANLSIRERKDLRSGSVDVVGGSSKGWRWCSSQTAKSAALKYIGMRPMVWAGAR